MSYIQINIRDAERSIHGRLHGSRVDLIVASLASDPETIEELESALNRFQPNEDDRDDFRIFRNGTDYEPFDAGICVIDLAARVVACESTYSQPSKVGDICMVRAREGEDVAVMYHLAEDWKFVDSVLEYVGCEQSRRRERASNPPLDARPVIYGSVCRFIVEECITAVSNALKAERELSEDEEHAAIRQIHALWLTTPRDDLRSRAPRNILLDGHDHISWEMQDRAFYWSMMKQSPPPLSRDSHAYRYAAFGTHEIVVYYELVRSLICHAWNRQMEWQRADRTALITGDSLIDEILHLEGFKEDWLNSPDFSDLHGRIPAELIANERIRMPEIYGGSHVHEEGCCDHSHEECDHEHGECDHDHDSTPECDHEHDGEDCPICDYLNTPDFGPMFWCLDGCNMDEEFAFSFCRTQEEFDEKHRKFDEEYEESKERERIRHESAALWETKFERYYDIDYRPKAAIEALAAHSAELVEDLKQDAAQEELIDELCGAIESLQAISGLSEVVPPDATAQRVCDALEQAASQQPQLAAKCRDLVRRTGSYVELVKHDPHDEDLPF